MRTIICGSRHLDQPSVAIMVQTAISMAPFPVTEIVSGCARGPDSYGEAYGKQHGLVVHRFSAQWRKHGKRAGPLRNQEMADFAEACIAIWDGESSGTADMLRRAEARGLKVYVTYVHGDKEKS